MGRRPRRKNTGVGKGRAPRRVSRQESAPRESKVLYIERRRKRVKKKRKNWSNGERKKRARGGGGEEKEKNGDRTNGTRGTRREVKEEERRGESMPVRGVKARRREGESPKTVVGSSPLLRIRRHNGIDNVTGVTSISFSFFFSLSFLSRSSPRRYITSFLNESTTLSCPRARSK